MKLRIEFEREEDGRWVAEVAELPGVMVYGATREEAGTRVKILALKRVADMLAHGELAMDSPIELEETTPAA